MLKCGRIPKKLKNRVPHVLGQLEMSCFVDWHAMSIFDRVPVIAVQLMAPGIVVFEQRWLVTLENETILHLQDTLNLMAVPDQNFPGWVCLALCWGGTSAAHRSTSKCTGRTPDEK